MTSSQLNLRCLEIGWHRGKDGNLEGIESIDYHPTENRLLTAAGDGTARIWSVDETLRTFLLRDQQFVGPQDIEKTVKFVASVSSGSDRGATTTAAARWSPSGKLIAVAWHSGDLTIFRQNKTPSADALKREGLPASEAWDSYYTMYVGNDVFDLSFTPDSRFVAVCTVQGSITLFDIESCRHATTLTGIHDQKCQGVTFDPWGTYLCSAAADRTVKFFVLNEDKKKVRAELTQTALVGRDMPHVKFKGESSAPFTRRCSWSPDGTLMAAPCGSFRPSSNSKPQSATFIFFRNELNHPMIALLSSSPTIGTRWAPRLFRKTAATAATAGSAELAAQKGDEDAGQQQRWGNDEYDMVLATWSRDTVEIFSQGSVSPLWTITDIHYDTITDVAFNPDCTLLFISSQDGFITTVSLENQLGAKYDLEREATVAMNAAATEPALAEQQQPRTVLCPVTVGVYGKLKPVKDASAQVEHTMCTVGRKVMQHTVKKKRRVEQSPPATAAAEKPQEHQEHPQPPQQLEVANEEALEAALDL